jgi:O-antigen ligase
MRLDHALLRPRNLPLTGILVLALVFTLTGLAYPFYVTRGIGTMRIVLAVAVVAAGLFGYYRPQLGILGVLFLAPILPIPLKSFLGYDAILHLYLVYGLLLGIVSRQRQQLWRYVATLDRLLLFAMLVFVALAVASGLIAGGRYSPTLAHLLATVSLDGFTRVHTSYATVMSFVFVSMNMLLGPFLFVVLGGQRLSMQGRESETGRRWPVTYAISAVLTGASVSLALAVVQAYAPARGLPLSNGWPSGLMTDSTSMGGTVGILIPLAVAAVVFVRHRVTVALAITMLILTAAVAAPLGSRITQLSILISPFLVGAVWVTGRMRRGDTNRRFWLRVAATGLIGLALTAGAAWLMQDTELGGYVDALARDPDMGEIFEGGRDALASEAIRMGLDYPIAGIGFGSFTWELLRYYELSEAANPWFDLPHNFYLQVFAEMGIIGAASLLLLIFALGRHLVRPIAEPLTHMRTGVHLGAASATLMSLFALFWGPFFVFVEYQVVFWLALFLLYWAGEEQEHRSDPAPTAAGYAPILSRRASNLWWVIVATFVVASLLSPGVIRS